ncbi:MAG: MarR family transcriptional regulator [Erysipelotrichaceae bacterium]|nr:MarR family transcriptional regulator [Erysipelotrichaceae bacterium]
MNENWQKYGQQIQLFHTFARLIVTQEKSRTLNTNEMEILSFIYLSENKVTPHDIALATGMKKEAVSRSLKTLVEKRMLTKQKDVDDERSYFLLLSHYGENQLNENYQMLFLPYKTMEQTMGSEKFSDLILALEQAADILRKTKER